MVINHIHKYLFIEVPRTGSTAIRNELVSNYGGEVILHKHATLSEFKRKSNIDINKYFVIAGKRNPLDRTISEYLKYKNDHNDVRNRFEKRVKHSGLNFLKYLRASYFFKRVKFAQTDDITFKDYYLKYFNRPYCDFGFLDHKQCDHVIEFGNLNEEFSIVLDKIGLNKKRDLPKTNSTKNKKMTFWSYYTEDFRAEAIENSKVYFSISGYVFPPNWKATPITTLDWVKFYYYNLPKIVYWKFFTNR